MSRRARRRDRAAEVPGAAGGPGGGAPRPEPVTWPLVLGEGLVLAVVGLLVWLSPGFGTTATLQLLAMAALATALVSGWRLRRDALVPAIVAAVALRSGVGLAVGILVVGGSLLVDASEAATLALAVVLGIGFVLYGATALLGPLLRREPGVPFPLGPAALTLGLVVVGAFLVVRADAGIASLTDTYSLIGLLLAATGTALVGWSLMVMSGEGAAAS